MDVREELNELLNEAIDVAAGHLARGTEFLPFAVATQAEDGEIYHVEPDDEDITPDQELIVDALRGALRDAARGGRWKAVAIVADVTVEDEEGEAVTSAIHIQLEHAAGESVSCTIPYSLDDEAVELADMITEPADLSIFAAAPLN